MDKPFKRPDVSFVLCSLLFVLGGCAAETVAVKPEPPKVTVAHPEIRELTDYDEYNGWTAASELVELRSRVRGHIVKVDFTDGQVVEKDKILFYLDPQPFAAEVGRAQGQLEIAQSQLELAQKDEAREKMLFEKQAGTLQDYQRAEANRKTWEAQISSAEEEVKRRKLDAEYAQIKAPIAGKVSRAQLTEGNLVNAGGGDQVLTTIVKIDPIHVYFNVDERSLIRYRERRAKETGGDLKPLEDAPIPFDFALESDRGFPHHGALNFADNKIDPTTGTIEIRGTADNPQGIFVPGGRVRVRVAVSEPYQGVLVPDTSVLTDQDKKYLLVLNAENVVLRRNVTLGRLLDDGMRVILPGGGKGDEPIRPDDRVIVLGLQRARVNYPVDPVDDQGNPVPAGT